MADAMIAYCTVPDAATGKRIADELVKRRLAACVNRIPGLISTYEWQGEICEDGEDLLLIKTRRDCLDALERTLGELHPYELPELVAVPIDGGSAGYLDWINRNTQHEE